MHNFRSLDIHDSSNIQHQIIRMHQNYQALHFDTYSSWFALFFPFSPISSDVTCLSTCKGLPVLWISFPIYQVLGVKENEVIPSVLVMEVTAWLLPLTVFQLPPNNQNQNKKERKSALISPDLLFLIAKYEKWMYCWDSTSLKVSCEKWKCLSLVERV